MLPLLSMGHRQQHLIPEPQHHKLKTQIRLINHYLPDHLDQRNHDQSEPRGSIQSEGNLE